MFYFQWEKSLEVLGTAKDEDSKFKIKDINIKLKKVGQSDEDYCAMMKIKTNELEFRRRNCERNKNFLCHNVKNTTPETSTNSPGT